jgi:D-3-phosphoglycerate dehydrogenase
VRESNSSSAQDFVNLITLRGTVGDRPVHVAGTLGGHQQVPRIVGIDEHIVDLPPSRHMLVVHNDDRPGMIGTVGTILGEAGVNISDMDVGRGPAGNHALMIIAVDTRVEAATIEALQAKPGILLAKAIEL